MKTRAKELTDASVSHISLVDRGANREPFRIIKAQGEDEMLDFSKGFTGLFQKTEARAPAIIAVAFAKHIDPAAAAKVLKDAGLEHGDAVSSDEALTFPINGAVAGEMETAVVFKMSEDLAIAVRYDDPETVRKGFTGYDFESTDFKSVLGTNTSMPAIGIGMKALQDTIYNIMSDADTVEVAKADIAKALEDFSGYTLEVVDRIPATAFKLDAATAKIATAKAENGDQGSDTENGGKGEPAPTGQITDEEARKLTAEPTEAEKAGEGAEIDKPADDDAEKVEKIDPELITKANAGDVQALAVLTSQAAKLTARLAAGSAAGEEGDPAPVVKKDDEPVPAAAELTAAITAAVTKALEPVQSQLASFGETVTKVSKDVQSTQAALKKVDETLGIEVVGAESGDDDDAETVQKVDLQDGEEATDEGYLVIDTGHDDPFPERRPRKAA